MNPSGANGGRTTRCSTLKDVFFTSTYTISAVIYTITANMADAVPEQRASTPPQPDSDADKQKTICAHLSSATSELNDVGPKIDAAIRHINEVRKLVSDTEKHNTFFLEMIGVLTKIKSDARGAASGMDLMTLLTDIF